MVVVINDRDSGLFGELKLKLHGAVEFQVVSNYLSAGAPLLDKYNSNSRNTKYLPPQNRAIDSAVQPPAKSQDAAAKVAELADALDLGSSGATREGSSPSFRIGPTLRNYENRTDRRQRM